MKTHKMVMKARCSNVCVCICDYELHINDFESEVGGLNIVYTFEGGRKIEDAVK